LKPVRRKRSNFIVVTLRSGSAHLVLLTIVFARGESFFARPKQGLAAIGESRNQPHAKENVCETEGSPRRRLGKPAHSYPIRPGEPA
jgi:hypothetical protein